MDFSKFKKLWFFRLLRRFRFLVKAYHYSWAVSAALLNLFPSRKIFVIGITGTKGKTTVIEILNNILTLNGDKTAVLSSLYFRVGEDQEKNTTNNTMPGRMFIQKFLRRAVNRKCKYALVEVTSEGVEMSRHRFINWRIGVLNNLAPEHIESHGSFAKYREAKLKFLKYVFKKGGSVFLNEDDSNVEFFKDQLKGGRDRVKFFSKTNFKNIFPSIDNTKYLFSSDFNQENLAAAVAIAKWIDVDEKIISKAVSEFKGVAGRMEFIQQTPFLAVVDYAHTPASLEKVYANLRGKVKGRLICVLGSAGGGRDKWKRPEMGKIADSFCDQIILTDEDPYDEDPEGILGDVQAGIKNKKIIKILNRGEAIQQAVNLAREEDGVVVTGKGSELYIHIKGGRRTSWSDSETLRMALEKK